MNTQILQTPLEDIEIDRAMFSFGPYKAPGSDGLHPFFYQKFWPDVSSKVRQFCHDIFESNVIPHSLNQTYICLVPKVRHAQSVHQFRPSSLRNTTYKLITKILVNRLKPIISLIIGPTQTSFQQGKRVADNAIIVQEAIN